MNEAMREARRDWAIVVVAGIVTGALLHSGTVRHAAAGVKMEFPISVVPSDAHDLDCASSDVFAGRRCAFSDKGEPSRVIRPLRPFTTSYGEHVLMADVFEEPHVGAWLEQARSTGNEERVTLYCKGVVLGRAAFTQVRWHDADAFGPDHDMLVGVVQECRVAR